MKQILKIYESIFHLLEFQYQAHSETDSFEEFVLNHVLLGLDRLSLNDPIVQELYESSKTKTLFDVEIEYPDSLVGKDINLALTYILQKYDMFEVDVRSKNFLQQKLQPQKHSLLSLTHAISENRRRQKSIDFYKQYILTGFTLLLSMYVMGMVDASALDGVTDFSTIFNVLGEILVLSSIVFLIPNRMRIRNSIVKINLLSVASVLLINQLGLLTQSQLFIINQDVLVFFKLMLLGYGLSLIFKMFSTLVSRQDAEDVYQSGVLLNDDLGPVTIYRKDYAVAQVVDLKLTLKNNLNFEYDDFKSL